LDEIGPEDQSMQPKSQHWIWMTLAVLALTMISYIALAQHSAAWSSQGFLKR
jgi:hypothetical protein